MLTKKKTAAMSEFFERGAVPCHVIKYEDLCERPKEILEPVFEFLDEPWEEGVLNFHEVAHDRGNEDGRVGATRGFSVSKGHYLGWPEEVRQRCWEIVAPVATGLGYRI